MNLKQIRTTAQPVTDEWFLQSTLRGIQVQKNGRNTLFADSFEKAWEFVKRSGTPGDHITIKVDGVLNCE